MLQVTATTTTPSVIVVCASALTTALTIMIAPTSMELEEL